MICFMPDVHEYQVYILKLNVNSRFFNIRLQILQFLLHYTKYLSLMFIYTDKKTRYHHDSNNQHIELIMMNNHSHIVYSGVLPVNAFLYG